MATKDLVTEKLDAQLRETEAQLDVLQAQAEARKAKEEMDELSGLRAKREHAKQKLADMKQKAPENLATRRREAQSALNEFQAGVKRMSKNFVWFDEAAQRRLDAQVQAAEAKLRVWKAHAEVKHAEHAMKRHDALVTLEESIALTRARDAERRLAAHSQKAAEALVEAAHQLDKAYDTAAKLYEKK